jgi:hypothetical protein
VSHQAVALTCYLIGSALFAAGTIILLALELRK